MSDYSIQSRRTYTIAFGVMMLLVLLLGFSGTLAAVLETWMSVELESTSHGFLVFGCAIYLVFINRPALRTAPISPQLWGAILLALLSIAWFMSVVIGIRTVELTILPLLIGASVFCCFGPKYFRIVLIPVVLLLFAMPIWWPLLPYLVEVTTNVTHGVLRVVGKPVFVEDNFIHLPGGTFKVDDSCAGLRYLTVSGALSLITISAFNISYRKAVSFSLGIIGLSLFANWLRVVTIVLIGDYTNMQHELVNDHVTFGWVVYSLIVLLPLFLYTSKLESVSVDAEPLHLEEAQTREGLSAKHYVALGLTFICFILGPAIAGSESGGDGSLSRVVRPLEIDLWEAGSLSVDSFGAAEWRPNFNGATHETSSRYENDNESLELHLVHYAGQAQDAELINVNNSLVIEPWRTVPESSKTTMFALGNDVQIKAASFTATAAGNRRKQIWYWYNIGGYQTSNDYFAKLYQIPAMLKGRNDATLIAVARDCQFDCENEDAARQFIEAAYPEIQLVLSD